MAPKTKQLLFTPQMVAALLGAILGAGGGTFGGFSAGSSKAEVQAYRIDQLEAQATRSEAARVQEAAVRAELDKRLTVLEDSGKRFQKQLDRFDSILERWKR